MTGTDTSTDLQVRAQAALAAWGAHDMAAVVSSVAEDVVYTDKGIGRRIEGRTALREYLEGLESGSSSDHQMSFGQVIGDDDLSAVEWTMTGTHDGFDETTGWPATRRRFRVDGVTVNRSRNGQIVESTLYWNLADLLQQIGLLPAPGSATASS